ncbi:MAG: ankyrin repeat domain-containing protein [Rickettsiales bacterium]
MKKWGFSVGASVTPPASFGVGRRFACLCATALAAGTFAARAQSPGSLPDFNLPPPPEAKQEKITPELLLPESAPPPSVDAEETKIPAPEPIAITPKDLPKADAPAASKKNEGESFNQNSPYGNISNTPAAKDLAPAPDARPKKGQTVTSPPLSNPAPEGQDPVDKYKYRPSHSPAYAKQYKIENLHLPSVEYESDYIRLFFDAVAADNVDAVRGLFSYFKTTEFRDASQNTPLMYACMLGRRRMVEILLGMGANPNSYNRYRVTPLMIAAKEKRHDFASLLLHYDATPDLTDKFGHTALMYAASANSPETVLLLARYGADLNAARYSDGSSALHLAVHYNNPEAGYMLMKNGANPDVMNAHRITPLMLAANYNNGVLARLLLKFNADPYLIDRKGRTAENFAWARKNFTLARTLSRYRFDRDAQLRARPPRPIAPMRTEPQETPYPPPPYYAQPQYNPYNNGYGRSQPIPPAAPGYDAAPPPYAPPAYDGQKTLRSLGEGYDYSDQDNSSPYASEPIPEDQGYVPERSSGDKPRVRPTPVPVLKPEPPTVPAVPATPPPAKEPGAYVPPPYAPPPAIEAAPVPKTEKPAKKPTPSDAPTIEIPPKRTPPPALDKTVTAPLERTPPPPPEPKQEPAVPPSPASQAAPEPMPSDLIEEFNDVRAAPPPPPSPSGKEAPFSIVNEPKETEFSKQELEEMQRILRDLEKQDGGASTPAPPPSVAAPPAPKNNDGAASHERASPPSPTGTEEGQEDSQRVEMLENFYNSMKKEIDGATKR